MPRRSSIHRDLRSPKYRPRVVTSKKKRPPRHKPDWRRELEVEKDSRRR
jgi:hypothetical protein